MADLSAFSDNQKRRVGFNPSTTNPLACGMICREHVKGNATSYQCQGACNKVLPLSQFSKSTRRNHTYVSSPDLFGTRDQKTDYNNIDLHSVPEVAR